MDKTKASYNIKWAYRDFALGFMYADYLHCSELDF